MAQPRRTRTSGRLSARVAARRGTTHRHRRWRSTRAHPEVVTDQIPEQPVDDAAQQTVDRQLVFAALRTLSTEHRQVLLECYFRGASTAEAGKTLGVPRGTIKSRTHHALHALRQALDEMESPA